MKALLQRVSEAAITIDRQTTAQISRGLLVFLGIEPQDTDAVAAALITRLLKYRIFGDDAGKMNLSLAQTGGELLLVPQFTLAADTRHGLRPGFSTAAPPSQGLRLFDVAVSCARAQHGSVQTGTFGADMQVSLTNDGPVTFWLEG